MKATQLVKGSIWRFDKDMRIDPVRNHDARKTGNFSSREMANSGVMVPEGTNFVVEYSRVIRKHMKSVPIKILDNEVVARALQESQRPSFSVTIAGFARNGGYRPARNTSRFSDADALVEIDQLSGISFVSGRKTEFYIRVKGSVDKFLQPRDNVYGSLEDAKFFVSVLSAMKQLYFRKHVAELEIVEYDPFTEKFFVVEVCPDWVYSVEKMTQHMKGSSIERDISNFRGTYLPETGKLAGLGYINDLSSAALIKQVNESISIHSRNGKVIGFTDPEDITLLKIAMGDKVDVIYFD